MRTPSSLTRSTCYRWCAKMYCSHFHLRPCAQIHVPGCVRHAVRTVMRCRAHVPPRRLVTAGTRSTTFGHACPTLPRADQDQNWLGGVGHLCGYPSSAPDGGDQLDKGRPPWPFPRRKSPSRRLACVVRAIGDLMHRREATVRDVAPPRFRTLCVAPAAGTRIASPSQLTDQSPQTNQSLVAEPATS